MRTKSWLFGRAGSFCAGLGLLGCSGPGSATTDALEDADAGSITRPQQDHIAPGREALHFSGSTADAITIPWAKSYGGAGDDIAQAMALDSSRNAYVTGTFENTVAFGGSCGSLTASGTDDMFLAAYGSTGTCSWVKSFGAAGATTAGLAIAIDASNVYVTGLYSASTDFGAAVLGNSGGWDCFVSSYTLAAGTSRWANNCGATSGDDVGYGITVGSSKVAVAGEISSNAQDAFLNTYSTAGVASWSKTLGSTGYDTGRAVGIDSSGKVYFAGGFSSTVTFIGLPTTSTAGVDAFAIQYSSSGTAQSFTTFGGSADDYALKMVVDSSDKIIMSGEFRNSIGFLGLSATGNANPGLFVGKFGIVLGSLASSWLTSVTSTSEVYGNGLAVDGSNNVYVAGTFGGTTNFGGGNRVSAGGIDAVIAKFSSAGAYVSDSVAGSTGDDEATGVGYYSSGSTVTASGYIHGSVTIGSTTLNSVGNADIDLYSLSGM